MAYGTVQADVIGTSVAGSNLGAGNASTIKNRIINGAMVINQRGFSGNITTGNEYTLDRFQGVTSVSNKFSIAQSSTAPAGFSNSLLVTSISAYTVGAIEQFYLRQSIEAYNTNDLGWGTANAKTVTLSFQVYSSLTGTFGGALFNSNGSRSYPFTYTVSSANTWTSISVTIAGDTSGTWAGTNGVGITVAWGLGVGSTLSGTAGTWAGTYYASATGATSVVGTSGATFYITGVQLEVGSSATGFEYRQYGTELSLCQRYYETFTLGSDESLTMQAISTSRARGGWQYKIQKRATATNTSSGTFALTTSTSGGAGTATVAFIGGSLDVCAIDATGVSSMVAGNATNAYGGAKLTASAEL